MAEKILVGDDISDGEALIRQLDRDNFPVTAAFWFYRSEPDTWSLMIASPVVAAEGPRVAYQRLDESIQHITTRRRKGLSFDPTRIQVVKESDELPSLLRRAVATDRPIAGIRLTGSAVGGRFIEDAYIYRMEAPAKAA